MQKSDKDVTVHVMSGTERVSGSEVGQLQLQAAVFNYTVFSFCGGLGDINC